MIESGQIILHRGGGVYRFRGVTNHATIKFEHLLGPQTLQERVHEPNAISAGYFKTKIEEKDIRVLPIGTIAYQIKIKFSIEGFDKTASDRIQEWIKTVETGYVDSDLLSMIRELNLIFFKVRPLQNFSMDYIN